jgi:hypothetical protein
MTISPTTKRYREYVSYQGQRDAIAGTNTVVFSYLPKNGKAEPVMTLPRYTR